MVFGGAEVSVFLEDGDLWARNCHVCVVDLDGVCPPKSKAEVVVPEVPP